MSSTSSELVVRLISLVRASVWLMAALRAARELNLPSWCIGAGAIRNLVWDHLNNLPYPSALRDVDVAYFDASQAAGCRDRELEDRLRARLPSVPWEVTNQALVHLWFEDVYGHPVRPLISLEDAVSTWPEFATSVGIHLADDDQVQVIAPHGLDDLFAQVVRRNPARVSLSTYRERIIRKSYTARWPGVTIVSD